MHSRCLTPLSLRARLGRAAMFCALVALLPTGTADAQSDVIWRHVMPKAVEHTRIDALGHLLVITQDGITALDPDSGSEVWRYPARDSITVLRHLSTGRELVGSGRTLAAVDLATGAVAWQRADLPDLAKAWIDTDPRDSIAILQTHDGFAVLDLVTGMTAWDSTAFPAGTVVREFFRYHSLGLLLLLARSPSSPVTLIGMSLEAGTVRWSDPSMFRNEVKFKRAGAIEYAVVQPPVTLPDTTVMLYFSTDGPLRVDLRSGKVLWRSTGLAGAPVPTSRDGYARSRLMDSVLVVPSGKRLVALDTATGQARWFTKGEFPGRPGWVAFGPGAIATGTFASDPFVTILGADGARRGPTDIRLGGHPTGLLVGDTLYVASEGTLYAIPLATGVARGLAAIGFQGNESPMDIDSLEGGGLVLMGEQNLVRIDRDGTVVYRRYYPAPGLSVLEALALAGGGPSATSHAWSLQAHDYYYIFTVRADTAGKEGFSLVVLDRRDGRELGRMWFDERNPHGAVNGRTGTVYEVEDKKKIVARRFPGLPAVDSK